MPKDDAAPVSERELMESDLRDHILYEEAFDRANREWDTSSERKRSVRNGVLIFIGSAILAIIIAILVYVFNLVFSDSEPTVSDRREALQQALSIGAVLFITITLWGLITAFQLYARSRRIFRARRQREHLLQDLSATAEAAKDPGDTDFATLWALTNKRLTYYHDLATRQAEVSFRHAQGAMIAGFAVAMIAMIIALFPSSVGKSIVVGGIGSLVAVLAAYISKTFLRSQEIASSHLRAYFLQPLEASRYLIAERLVNSLGTEKRDDGLLALIQGIAQSRVNQSDQIKS